VSLLLSLRRGAAVARRMAVLTLFGLTVLGSWIYWHAPSLNELRPEIQHYMQKRFDLSALQMGDLSWYWAGYLWLHADDLSFATRDGRVRLDGGRLAIRVSMWRLLFGEWRPDRVNLSNGELTITLPAGTGDHQHVAALIPLFLRQNLNIQDTALHWQYGKMEGRIPHLSLNIDADDRSLELAWPGLQLNARLDTNMLPERLDLALSSLQWLPPALRRSVHGAMHASMRLRETDSSRWLCNIAAHSDAGATIVLEPNAMELNFQQLKMQAVLVTDNQESAPGIHEIRIDPLEWTQGQNSARLTAVWNAGVLEVKSSSGHLDMPTLWSWLRPLGDTGWRRWLASMHSGTATHVEAKMAMPWADPGKGLPTDAERQHLQYRVDADVTGADIALGLSGDALTNTNAKVELDATGLKADISAADLPRGIGSVQGTLLIPWSSLMLDIQGQANIRDVASLIRWKRPDPAAAWFTTPSRATGTFALLWNPDEDRPRSAQATLHPDGDWPMHIGGLDLVVSGGLIQWDIIQGLQIDKVHVATDIMQGNLSMAMAEDAKNQWVLRTLDTTLQGGMADMVSRFRLPVAAPQGRLSIDLHYRQGWKGAVNLTAAAWSNILGTTKAIGEPFTIRAAGQGGAHLGVDEIRITQLSGDSRLISFNGTGLLTPDSLHLNLDTLKSYAFDGKVQVVAPFGPSPWEIDVRAKYMSRVALPKQLQQEAEVPNVKPWALRAHIDRFDWDAATILHANLQLASSTSSIGVFDAKRVDTGGMHIRNVHAVFTLPGAGAIDLRQCTGQIEQQKIELSAEMTPQQDSPGMRWRGYAFVTGDFGHLLKRAGISKRFLHGDMRLLFAGQGMLNKDKPWWQGLDGRLRLRVDNGRIMEGGTLTKLLAAMNLADLPKLFIGQRGDLAGPGMMYDRLQMESTMHNQEVQVHKIALRSPAMDLAGNGRLTLDNDNVDIILIARPFQNLDAILSKIPLLRDFLGGGSYTLMRQVYWMHGPFTNATVERIPPEKAGLAPPGLVEALLSLPERWFGKSTPAKASKSAPANH
jgi:AsmA-like C-terminal region